VNSWFRVEIRSVFDRDWPNSLRRTCFFAVGFYAYAKWGQRGIIFFELSHKSVHSTAWHPCDHAHALASRGIFHPA